MQIDMQMRLPEVKRSQQFDRSQTLTLQKIPTGVTDSLIFWFIMIAVAPCREDATDYFNMQYWCSLRNWIIEYQSENVIKLQECEFSEFLMH